MTTLQRRIYRIQLLSRQVFVPGLICLSLGTASLLAQGTLAAAARSAKVAGQSAVTITVHAGDADATATAEDFLRHKSVMLVTLGGVQVENSDNTIYSWHIGRIDRVLRTAPVFDQEWCTSVPKPKPTTLKPGEVALGLMGGTATISDVAVTVTTGDPVELVAGTQVLVVGLNCGSTTLVLPHRNDAVFDVAKTGVLSHRGATDYPFVKKLFVLNSISAIEKYLQSIK